MLFEEIQNRGFYIHYKAGIALFLNNVKHRIIEFI